MLLPAGYMAIFLAATSLAFNSLVAPRGPADIYNALFYILPTEGGILDGNPTTNKQQTTTKQTSREL